MMPKTKLNISFSFFYFRRKTRGDKEGGGVVGRWHFTLFSISFMREKE